MTNRKQVALFAGAAAVAASACYLLLSRYRNPREAPKGTLTVRGDSSNIAALRDHFELDKVLWNLKLCFNVRFVEVAPSPTAAPTPTAFELERSTASHSYNVVANALLLGTMEGNLRHRRSVLVPPYIIRWLRWEAQQQQISSALDYPSTPTGVLAHGSSFPVEPPAPPLPPKARSGDVLESGAVAGAVPDTRRRRTVEERVMRVALDVLAPLTAGSRLKSVSGQPPTPPRNPPVTPSMSASAPLDESKLPFDTFIADATCAETVIHANIANEYSSRNGASEYVAALLYLMDVAACNGERLPAARRIADETAARIVHQHRGQLESVSRALEPILGSTIEVTSMNHLVQILLTHANTIGSYAINHFGALGGGALAAGSADRTLTNLLDAGQDTVALLAFPMCSLGAFFLLREIYDTVVAHYGSWRMEGFTALNAKLWDRATSKVPPSSWSRLFRSMNRSRTGEISYHEYCSHFAKKVSACGDDFDPDLALVLSLARLRFNHLLFFSRNIEWPGRSFWFDALVDAHDNRE